MVARKKSQILNGQFPLSYLGVVPVSPTNFLIEARPPTGTDAQNVFIGDVWLDDSSYPVPPKAENIWVLVSLANGIATWVNLAGGGDLKTLTGNVGGAVAGDAAHNINTVGDNIGITVVGNPGTNTLTWSLVGGGGGVATQSFHTDDNNVEVPIGTAVIPPVGSVGQINEFGGASGGNFYININTAQGIDIHTIDINLNNSIGQPDTNITGTEGMYALGTNNNFVLDRFMYNYGTNNTFLGNLSGSLGLTIANATNNIAVGTNAGNSLLGTGAFQGAFNVLLGSNAAPLLTNGSSNVIAGNLAGSALLTGSNNVLLGQGSGTALVAAESSNIYLGAANTGVIGDNNTLRIGNASGAGAGNLNRAFCQGIYGVAPAAPLPVVINAAGQLGTGVGPINPFATTGFYATTTGAVAPFTLGVYLTIPLDTIVFDLGGNFNTGTYTYTCPSTGYYWFNAQITLTAAPATITECSMAYQVAGGGKPGLFGPMGFNAANYTTGIGFFFGGSWMNFMTAGDTLNFQVSLGGTAGNCDIEGGSGRTLLQGYRIF